MTDDMTDMTDDMTDMTDEEQMAVKLEGDLIDKLDGYSYELAAEVTACLLAYTLTQGSVDRTAAYELLDYFTDKIRNAIDQHYGGRPH
jgi:hypothetical protein